MVLEHLLKERRFHYLKLLNRRADLSRMISTVESTEAVDVAEYIPQNTFLLMTGMAFQDNQQALCEFLESLERKNCAGVAIKLGRFIEEIEGCVLETADTLQFPVFQIPMDMTLGEVYHEILSYLWDSQNESFLNAMDIQKKLSGMVLQGNSLRVILNHVASVLERAVMVVDMFGNPRDCSYNFSKEAKQKVERIANTLMEKQCLWDVDTYLYEEKEEVYAFYPIKSVGTTANYLIVRDFVPDKNPRFQLVMEKILSALQLHFAKELHVRYNQLKVKEKAFSVFMEQIMQCAWSKEQALIMGEAYGIKQAEEYQVALVSFEDRRKKFHSDSFTGNEELYVLIYDKIRELLGDREVLVVPLESGWKYMLLIQGEEPDIEEKYIRMHDTLKERANEEIRIFKGGVVSSILNVKESYEEAESCITQGETDKEHPYIFRYRSKDIIELLRYIPEKEKEEMCRYTLKELAFPGNQMEEELRKTLQTYLFCGNSVTRTAELMFLHRNTIKYRIKKCEEILGVTFTDTPACFKVCLALILSNIK